jgi:hypothetical protein
MEASPSICDFTFDQLQNDFFTPSFDDTTISSGTTVILCEGSFTSDAATVEELHVQALEQERLVTEACRHAESLAIRASTLSPPVNSVSLQPDECLKLHLRDKIYLSGKICASRLMDAAYVSFCSCLTPEWLRNWIWIFRHTSRRSRQCILVYVPLFAVIWLFRKPLLQCPDAVRFPSNHRYIYARNHWFDDTAISEMLVEELL